MAKIYISSTYEDLKEERQAAARALRRLGHQSVAMEDYTASDKWPVNKCLKDVRNCDVYVGIFAWRYGFIPGRYDQSMAHLEYKAAKKAGKNCLIFLLDKKAQWPVEYVDTGKERVKIEQLREELQKKHVVSFFENADQLGSLVSAAVSNIFASPLNEPGPGQSVDIEASKPSTGREITRTPRLKWILSAFPIIALLVIAVITVLSNQQIVKKQVDTPSIAVLPFEDMSSGKQQEFFCDGIVEELIIALTKIEGLRVVSRTSSFQFKGKDIEIPEIGKKLKVKNVLEGSVRKTKDELILSIQLTDVSNGYLLWGEKYIRELNDIFDVQDEIAGKIVDALEIKLKDKRSGPFIKRYTENVEAYTLYLKGRHFWSRRLPEDLAKGIEFFRKAIDIDPNYALAYVGIADSYQLLATYSILPPKQAFPQAKEAALKALEIDNNLGEAHNSLAAVKLFYEWDWHAAEREFKRAIELNPNFYTAHEWYSEYLAVMGRIDEAIAEMKRAAELEPFSTSSQAGIARHLYYAKKFDDSILHFQQALKLDPNSFLVHAHLGQTYIMKSMYPDAIAHFKKAVALTGGKAPGMLCGLGYAYAVSGRQEEARQILKRLINISKQRYIPPYYIAGICVGLGDRDQAFQWLEKAYIDRSEWLLFLKIEHMVEPIRDDPRFAELIKKVGLNG